MSFEEQLETVIGRWESGDIDDEWMFQKLREDIVGRLSPGAAFEKIPSVLAKLQDHKGESVAIEILETVLALAIQSDTTEAPNDLAAGAHRLHDQFAQYGEYAKKKLEELFRYYRI
jgi:hypothetical protein